MGVVLQTTCPTKEGKDVQTIQEQLEKKHEAVKWKYGQVKMHPAGKPSPFIGPFQVDSCLPL